MSTNQTLFEEQKGLKLESVLAPPNTCSEGDLSTAFEPVLITLTLPFWTFITLCLLLLLIHYIRRVQYTSIYDKCNTKNAHFQYNFHIVIGRHTPNYSRLESHLIIDLLDNQSIPTMTIQIPGATLFNDSQILTYRHSRQNLRSVNFTIYRRHPIKDVRCIRVAHNCNNSDSRLFIYGINFYDATNVENKFFPVLSVVKYRGTQWALNTTFESKNDMNFRKLGCDCYDPFSVTNWPTCAEIILIVFYLWCACLCFGSIIPVSAILSSVTLHALTVSFIAGTSTVVIGLVYLRLIKNHIVDSHYESNFWFILQVLVFCLVLALSIAFWSLSSSQLNACRVQSIDWISSCVSSATILTALLLIIYTLLRLRRRKQDNTALEESDNMLLKTNSRPNLEFVREQNSFLSLFQRSTPNATQQQQQLLDSKKTMQLQKSSQTRASTGSGGSTATKTSAGSVQTKRSASYTKKTSAGKDRKAPNNNDKKEETLDNAFSSGAYMKTKNRNSISQYV